MLPLRLAVAPPVCSIDALKLFTLPKLPARLETSSALAGAPTAVGAAAGGGGGAPGVGRVPPPLFASSILIPWSDLPLFPPPPQARTMAASSGKAKSASHFFASIFPPAGRFGWVAASDCSEVPGRSSADSRRSCIVSSTSLAYRLADTKQD